MSGPISCLEEMPHSELAMWISLDEIRADEQQQAEERAKKGMRSTPRRR